MISDLDLLSYVNLDHKGVLDHFRSKCLLAKREILKNGQNPVWLLQKENRCSGEKNLGPQSRLEMNEVRRGYYFDI